MEHGSSEPSDRHSDSSGTFTTETAELAESSSPAVERLRDGDRFEFHIGPVRRRLDGADLRMLALTLFGSAYRTSAMAELE
jgi:hypothetical protein